MSADGPAPHGARPSADSGEIKSQIWFDKVYVGIIDLQKKHSAMNPVVWPNTACRRKYQLS